MVSRHEGAATKRSELDPAVEDTVDIDDSSVSQDRQFVTALARGLDVLSCFKRGENSLSNSEIAARCNLARPTVSRLTYTLTKIGYLSQVPETGGYRHGIALIALGASALASLDIPQVVRPSMLELALFSNASVALGVRDRLSMRYIECCKSKSPIALTLDVGSRISIARSAMGRAYLAVCDRQERDSILQDLRSVDEKVWPALREGIDRALEEYSRYGCATSFGDWEPNVSGIAVGLRPGRGLSPMSINCGGPSVILTRDYLMQEVRPRLISLASGLEKLL